MNKNNDKVVEYLIIILQKLFENCSEQDSEYLSEESIEGIILNIVRLVGQENVLFLSFSILDRPEVCSGSLWFTKSALEIFLI